jgi:hypothetical protein
MMHEVFFRLLMVADLPELAKNTLTINYRQIGQRDLRGPQAGRRF